MQSKGFFRHTAVCLRVAMLLDRVGENSPQDCFLPQAKPAPSLFESLANKKRKSHTLRYSFFIFGGEQGIRTLEQVIARYTISNRLTITFLIGFRERVNQRSTKAAKTAI